MRSKATAYMLIFALLASGFVGLWAQTAPTGTGERTVEEAYVQDSTEAMILREEAQAETKDSKLLAIAGIRDAIDAGRTGDDLRGILQYLAEDGLVFITREAGIGRPKNNFPDVRRDACDLLGNFKSEEAKDTLLRVLMTETEPMVLGAAVRSLGKIGINTEDETSQTISLIANRFDILMPDNSLAFEILVAFERLAKEGDGLKDPLAIKAIIRIAEGNYVAPVKNKALELLKSLRKAPGK